ncbi:ABC transporter permease [Gordonia sp. CPCC 206044]|uniref:ABC transporter permease n=1 Tax=Gordonia sp. CPCC 206044 TaxID=3140793 RepID=UPI003AF3CC55
MTATLTAAPTTRTTDQFAQTWRLVGLMARRERIIGLVTLVLFIAINAATAAQIAASYSTPAQRQLLLNGPGSNAAFRFLLGPLQNLESTAALTVWRAGLFMVAALGVCAVLMVVRHTRAEEELGRYELVRSCATGPLASLAAAAIVASGFCVVVALGMSLMLFPLGGTASGVFSVFAQYATTGLAAVGAALVTAQVAKTSHIANLTASAVVLIGYLLRGVADSIDGWSWLRWVSPMGWAEAIDPFGADNLWPAVASLAVFACGAVTAGVVVMHRDLGAGLIEPRPGPSSSARLGSVGAVAWRTTRSLLASWVVGIGVYALIVGFMQPSVNELAEGNEQVTKVLQQSGLGGDLSLLFVITMVAFLAVAASAWPVNLAERLRTEEAGGRTETLLGTPLSRSRFYLVHVVLAWLGVALAMMVAATALTVGDGIAGGGWSESARHSFAAAGAQIPAALVVGSIGLALYGVRPALAHVGWLIVIAALLLGPLAGMFGLPQWVHDLSPFTHSPQVPVASMQWTPIVVMVAVAAVFVGIGWAAFRRRDIT